MQVLETAEERGRFLGEEAASILSQTDAMGETMSLVITAWDRSVGVAVCEGRAVTLGANGEKIPAREDASKLSRLPDGSILGLTGGPLEGCTAVAVAVLTQSLITEPLRRDIHSAAETRGFKEICAFIPELIEKYRAEYPAFGFGVSLLGNDDGIIRGASWSTTATIDNDAESDVSANVIGLSKETNDEASRAVRQYFASTFRNYLHVSDVCASLEGIIKGLAGRHVELNDRIQFEFIVAPGTERSVIDASRMMAGIYTDGSSISTASRVLTATASPTSTGLSNSFAAVAGLAFTTTVASTSDVFNISACLIFAGMAVGVEPQVKVVDSVTGVSYGLQTFYAYAASAMNTFPFFVSITGLSAGAHTLQFYADTSAAVGSGNTISTSSYAVCQRIF